MNKKDIKKKIGLIEKTKQRNIVIVDFGNVSKWNNSLNWKIGIKELATLIKHLSIGKKYLRRFYYGENYGPKEILKF